VKAQFIKSNLEAVDASGLQFLGRLTIMRKESNLARDVRPMLEGFKHPAPGRLLRIVDLTEVEDLALRDLAAAQAMVLDDAPIAMNDPVLFSFVAAQKHDRRQ
jgi:hypothetical protein